MLSDSDILKKIEQQAKSAAGFKQLVRELGLRGEERKQLAEQLTRLVRRGDLVQLDSDRFAIPKATGRNVVVGRLSMHRDGYGFVSPDATKLPENMRGRLSGDIFVPPHQIGTAMHGDRVMVEVGVVRSDGRAEGRILRPLGRAHTTVVGVFHYGRKYNYITPMDEKITLEVIIPQGCEYPAGHARDHKSAAEGDASPHRVLGKEAARHQSWEDLEKVVVDVEITDWPTATQNPRGRVVEILGYPDDFGVDVEIMIRKFHLPHRFPADVLAEAQAASVIISSAELASRHDYRDLPIVTIDGETARDFDDAVLVRRKENGNYELQVHIADVAHYVTPGSALDREARLRGTSVYFPDRAVPMLPLELSTDACSLRPQVDRLVMSCVMEIDHEGEVVGHELHQGVIRSAERMTYTNVNLVIEGDEAQRQRYAALVPDFERMRELAMILNRKRERRGSIDFDLPEAVIEFDDLGLMRSIARSERNIAHRIIEEFMLAANECVAQHLEKRNIASLHRVHEKPDAKRVYDFEIIAASWGYSLGVGALPIQRMQMKTDRRASRGTGRNVRDIEIPREVHITPHMYQKLTKKIAGKPEERILSYLMLRSLKQARYSEENLGHFALATEYYTHFTSPIRRYPDLIVHRILKEVLRDAGTESGAEDLSDLRSDRSGSSVSPWSDRQEHDKHDHEKRKHGKHKHEGKPQPATGGPIPLEELHGIAEETSQSERRAAEAERGLLEWKKVKFMHDRVGEDFDGLIISVTKFGFFVELVDMFIEGLVPLATLMGDHFTFHENTRQMIGQRTRKTFSLGDRVRVLVDRIDPVERKISFALLEERPVSTGKRRKK